MRELSPFGMFLQRDWYSLLFLVSVKYITKIVSKINLNFSSENVVAIVMLLVRWLIPDVSTSLRDQIRREAYITNEIIIKQETLRVSSRNASGRNPNQLSLFNVVNNMTGSQLDLHIAESHQRKRKTKWTDDDESHPITSADGAQD